MEADNVNVIKDADKVNTAKKADNVTIKEANKINTAKKADSVNAIKEASFQGCPPGINEPKDPI